MKNLILIAVIQALFSLALASNDSPYCHKTVTVVEKAKGFRKLFKKTKQTTKLEKQCCAGYVMLDDRETCVPTCKGGCPVNATCIKPDVCQCVDGFKFNGPFCEPICETPCGENELCSAFNKCEPLKETTATTVTQPDTATELNLNVLRLSPETTGVEEDNHEDSVKTNQRLAAEDLYEDESIDYTEDSTSSENTTTFYLEETTTETENCEITGCVENSSCEPDGQCKCYTNFTLFYDKDLKLDLCLDAKEYQRRTTGLDDTPLILQTPVLVVIALTIVGVLVLLALIIYMKKQKVRLEVQEKNDLCCEYNTKSPGKNIIVY